MKSRTRGRISLLVGVCLCVGLLAGVAGAGEKYNSMAPSGQKVLMPDDSVVDLVDPATGAIKMKCESGCTGGGGGAATIADGADVNQGATTDAAATAGGTGTISAKLRNATALLDTLNTALSTLNAKLPSAATPADDTALGPMTSTFAILGCYDGANVDLCRKATSETTGVQIVRPHALLADRVSNAVGITDGSSTSLIAAQGSGVRFCATTIVVSNSSATNVTVDIRDGTAGSVLMTIPAAANMGGGVIPLGVPLCGSANTIFAADPSAAASTVTISAVGFKTTL